MIDREIRQAIDYGRPRSATVEGSGGEYVNVRLHADGATPPRLYRSVIAETPVGTTGALLRLNREESIFIPTGVVATGGGGSSGEIDGGAPDSTYDLVVDGGAP